MKTIGTRGMSKACDVIRCPAGASAPTGSRAIDDGMVCDEKNGAAEGTRTPDPIITNDVLYQLSYTGIFAGTAVQRP